MIRLPYRQNVIAISAVLAVAVVVCASRAPDAAPRRVAEKPAVVELAATKPVELSGIEVEVSDPRQTRPTRRAVTDLAVTLSPGRGELGAVTNLAGRAGVAAERRLFQARLAVVVAGRIVRAPDAWCDGFVAGVARCEADCDGGRFSLRRAGGAVGAFRLLLVGAVAGAADEAARGLVLTACRADSGDEMRLVPRRGDAAEVSLAVE